MEMAVVTTDLWGQVVDEWETRFDTEAPAFADVVPDLNQRLAGAAIVAHNAEYDLAFVRAEYRRAGWKLPQVPTLSTLEASAYYLPSLRRRRLADVSAALDTAAVSDGSTPGSTLEDARATAVLLAEFISPKPGKPPLPAHLDGLPDRAQKVTWPDGPTLEPQHTTPTEAGPDTTPDTTSDSTPGLTLVERFSLLDALDEGAPAGTFAYLEKLAQVLEDGSVTTQETSDLARVASAEELTSDDVARANEAFVRALTYAALDDGTVSTDEHTELLTVTDLLGVGRPLVEDIVATAEKARRAREAAGHQDLPENWALGEPLRVGDRVVFTGCDPETREQLETRSQGLGVRVVGTVSETTALLISDDSVDGTRAARARELGTRTVTPDEYALLLDHLQPAASREPATEPTLTTPEAPAPKAATSESEIAATEAVAAEPVAAEPEPEPKPKPKPVVEPEPEPVVADAESAVVAEEPVLEHEKPEVSEPEPTAVAGETVVTEPVAPGGAPVLEDAETTVPETESVIAVAEDEKPAVPEPKTTVVVEEPAAPEASVVEPALDPAPAAEPVEPKVTDEESSVGASTMVASEVTAPARKPRAPRKPRASIPKIDGPNAAAVEPVAVEPVAVKPVAVEPEAVPEPGVVTEVAPAPKAVTKPRASRAKAAPKPEVVEPQLTLVEEQLDVVVAKKAAPRKTAASRAKAAPNPVTDSAEAPVAPPKTAEVRAWARANGHPVSVRGALPKELIAAYLEAHSSH
ncbi:hypothetical protein Kisp02_15000 [Kineosporia sp. NBRC 101731]|nr:hypothetical protein Kisp02_15000 [Kineosporia sp. NBRC 101731]